MLSNGSFGPYFDGETIRWADALSAWRFLEAAVGSPEQTLVVIQTGKPAEALKAERELIKAGREALSLTPFDPFTGVGVTDLVAKRLVTQLIESSGRRG
jgi:hypothetical protein